MALLHRDRTHDAVDLRDADRPIPQHAAPGAMPADRATPVVDRDRAVADDDRVRDEPVVVRKNSFGQTLRTMLATILLVAVVAIAIANDDQFNIDLLFEQYDVSIAAVIGVAAGAGFLIGSLLTMGRRRRVS